MTPSLTVSCDTGTPRLRGPHVEQHAARFGGHAAHRPAVGLQRVGPARPALIDRQVGGAHDDAGGVEVDVELVRHDLPERGAGALTEVGLADVERGRVVLADDDPRVELAEVGIGVRAGALPEQRLPARGGNADHEHARHLDEFAARGVGDHAVTMAFAARLMAA